MTRELGDLERLRLIVGAFRTCEQHEDPDLESLVRRQFYHETRRHPADRDVERVLRGLEK